MDTQSFTQSLSQSTPATPTSLLDPAESFEDIARHLYAFEFSWDIERALEFALFRTYAVPSISGLLAKTGEFETRPRKRYDDTELLLAETMENGLDSLKGKRSIARMNAMHGRFRIANSDMLYVLSTFICEPIRWLERFGRRPMTPGERQAWFLYYRGLGKRMGIENIPDDLDTVMYFNEEFEVEHFRFADSNKRISEATIRLLLGFYLPRWLFWLGRPAVRAMLDPLLLEAMGLNPVPGWYSRLVVGALRFRARILRRLPKRRTPRLLTRIPRPTYPEGYRIEELGTFPGTHAAPGRTPREDFPGIERKNEKSGGLRE